jgi:hypothetical protein
MVGDLVGAIEGDLVGGVGATGAMGDLVGAMVGDLVGAIVGDLVGAALQHWSLIVGAGPVTKPSHSSFVHAPI